MNLDKNFLYIFHISKIDLIIYILKYIIFEYFYRSRRFHLAPGFGPISSSGSYLKFQK